jgi:glycosyltransferase involved in cell wall biosynthesis
MKINIALPVLNEERVLRQSVRQLLAVARRELGDFELRIVIADNGSTDRTEEIGRALAVEEPEVGYVRLAERGKGRAVFAAWESELADVYAFMDIDLSTDLAALPGLVEGAVSGGGLAVGSRFHPAAQVERSLSRRFFSAGYRLVLRTVFRTAVSDAPCGFKAIAHSAWVAVGPTVVDRRWFFDTELVLRAERAGFSLEQIPVVWREQVAPGRRSRVSAPQLCVEYLRCVWRLKKDLS